MRALWITWLIAVLLCLDTQIRADLIPNDPYFLPYQSYLSHIRAPAAWSPTSLGSPNTIIAVLDIGVNPNTPDLVDRVLPALSTTGFAPFDGTGTGKLAHGNFVASVIAGGVNNAYGGAGLGNFSILPIQIAQSNGANQPQWVADAILLAAANGARVINISSTVIDNGVLDYGVVETAAAQVKDQALVVIAAGNSNSPITMPAAYPDLLFVSGTDSSDQRWIGTGMDLGLGSSWGDFVNLAAPASNILVANGTSASAPYGTSSGTSFATAIVSGTAGLMFDANPSLTPAQVRDILLDTATDIGPLGVDPYFGAGLVNVGAAVAAAVPEPASILLTIPIVGLLLQRGRRHRA
jgi:subtilisin family serine protease